MNYFLLLLGFLLSVVAIYDMICTILSPAGPGFIADRVSSMIWRISVSIAPQEGRTKFLQRIGPFLLLIVVLIWIVLLWLGNTLIIYSDPKALWSATEKAYVSGFVENAYFTAYVLSSMGSGDFTPANDWWMFYTSFISFTGVVFISLGISFIIPVIEAITLRRQVSLQIHHLGKTPKEILERYQDDNFEKLLEILNSLEPSLLQLAQYHLAYPIIHYFHSTHLFEAFPVKFCTLDETMSIILYKVDNKNLSDVRALERAYGASTYYLSTLASAFIKPGDNEPERPNTSYLQNASVASSTRGTGHEKDLVTRRKLLLAYLQNDGWEWKDVEEAEDTMELKIRN